MEIEIMIAFQIVDFDFGAKTIEQCDRRGEKIDGGGDLRREQIEHIPHQKKLRRFDFAAIERLQKVMEVVARGVLVRIRDKKRPLLDLYRFAIRGHRRYRGGPVSLRIRRSGWRSLPPVKRRRARDCRSHPRGRGFGRSSWRRGRKSGCRKRT